MRAAGGPPGGQRMRIAPRGCIVRPMDPEFWHERWRAQQIGFHRSDVNPRLVAWQAELPAPTPPAAGSRMLVPLCGKSVDMAWLAERGHRVVGVELSPIASAAFFEERGLAFRVEHSGAFERHVSDRIEILCGDFFALDAMTLGACEGFYDRAALVALPEPMRARYVEQLAALLPAGARGLLVTFDYPQAAMSGPPFAVPDAEVRARYAPGFELRPLADHDVLAQELHLAGRGLQALHERVYGLTRR
jgi:thiopurine S-methyltransferase